LKIGSEQLFIGVFAPLSSLIQFAERTGKLPSGPFKPLGVERITEGVESYLANLQLHGIAANQIFSIEFSQRHQECLLTDNSWTLPPLSIDIPLIGKIQVIGRLEFVCSKGLIVFNEDDVPKAIEAWPSILVLCNLVKSYNLPIEKNIFFAKGHKSKKCDFNDPETLLVNLITYYFNAKNSPSPLLPEWVVPIISGDSEDLQQNFQEAPSDFKPIYDEYLKWLKRSSPHTDLHSAVQHWQSTAKTLFLEMGTSWYPKKVKVEQGVE